MSPKRIEFPMNFPVTRGRFVLSCPCSLITLLASHTFPLLVNAVNFIIIISISKYIDRDRYKNGKLIN